MKAHRLAAPVQLVGICKHGGSSPGLLWSLPTHLSLCSATCLRVQSLHKRIHGTERIGTLTTSGVDEHQCAGCRATQQCLCDEGCLGVVVVAVRRLKKALAHRPRG